VGSNEIGQCNVGDWTDIAQITVGWGHTVGLRTDGTAVSAGYNDYGQCKIGDWTDIKRVTAGEYYRTIAGGYGHTVGVKADGTVVTVGHNDDGQCNAYDWTDIIGVAAGNYHTVGLRADGTVLAAGLEVELAKWNLGNATLYLITSSTIGGEITGPGEGTFPYYRGRELILRAKPESGYRFVNWTGDVGAIADVNAAQTAIIVNDEYSITANFEKGQPVSWALIGGIAGAVVIVGLVILFVRRKKGVQKKGREKKATRTKRR
jgi:alpha-tubulin suppressor-like RCC1 family protein